MEKYFQEGMKFIFRKNIYFDDQRLHEWYIGGLVKNHAQDLGITFAYKKPITVRNTQTCTPQIERKYENCHCILLMLN